MRSLEEWTRYLERQEQAIKKAKSDARESPAETPPPEPVAVTPVQQATQVIPKPEPPALKVVETPAVPKPRQTGHAAPRTRRKSPKTVVIPTSDEETAQSSYQPFRESREQLLERLLDPVLTLEEAARVLNVCPTTVRRYTNKNVLRHHRTGGNQRRFKLSDVLELLESQGGIIKE